MQFLNPGLVAQRVSKLLNLSIRADTVGNTGAIDIRVAGLDRPHGFVVKVSAGLAHVYATLRLDNLAKPLLDAASAAPESIWQQFFSTRDSLALTGVHVEVSLNGVHATSRAVGPITSVALSAKSLDWREDPVLSAADIGATVSAMFLSLLPLDDPFLDADPTPEWEFSVEGAATKVISNHYERSRSNRAIAIMVHGTACSTCGFDFEAVYGELGEGYVEIHHLTPVHSMGEARVVNPLEELLPLCANCHRMVHRSAPPISPEALRGTILAGRS